MNKNRRLQKYIDEGTKNSKETADFLGLLTGGPLNLSRAIKSHRQCAEWTQQDLADRLEVSKQAVSKFEKGNLLPSLDTVIKIADAFEVDRETFVRLLFQEMVTKAGLNYQIQVEERPPAAS